LALAIAATAAAAAGFIGHFRGLATDKEKSIGQPTEQQAS